MKDDTKICFPQVKAPTKREVIYLRILILFSFCFSILFFVWLIVIGKTESIYLFVLLIGILTFRLFRYWHEWYNYFSPSVTPYFSHEKKYSVDVFTTYCKGEPKEMLLNTLKAIKQIKYPHGSYLCDESNDTELRKFCLDNDIFYVTRKKKIDAKAGNINNALKYSTSEIVLILDPDHVPVPDFLDRVLPYFNDNSVGFVQCIQSYYNHHETFISRAAAEQSFHFYGPMMMCNNSYNSVQAIGANCTFRRAALNSIGGHASGLAEDMHTSMMLQDKGWKSIYVPESLSKGLCPSTLSSYFNQQLKWSRGVFELLFRLISGFFSDLKIQQKIYYFSSSLFFLSGLFQMFELLLPFFSLWFSLAPIKINVEYFIFGCVILLLLVYSIRIYVQRWLPERNERGFHLKGGILLIGSWWIFLLGFIYSIFRVKVPYLPTPKSNKYSNDWLIAFPGFLLFVLSLPICYYGMEKDLTPFSVFMSIVFWVQLLPGFILFLNAITPSIPFLLDHFFNCQLNQLKAILSSISFLFRSVGNIFYSFFYRGFSILMIFILILFYHIKILNSEQNVTDLSSFVFDGKLNESEFDCEIYNIDLINYKSQNIARFTKDFALNQVPVLNIQIKNSDSYSNSDFLKAICYGYLNTNLKYISDFLLKCKRPVVISFSPDNFTDTLYTKHYINAWKYMFEYFNNSGVSNTVWLFPYTIKSLKYCFPGASYVDGFYLGTNIYESKHIVLQRIDEKENKPLFKFNRKYNKSGFKQLSYKKSYLIPIIYVSYFGTHPFSFPFDIINFLISFLDNYFSIDFDNKRVQFSLYNLHEIKKCKNLKRIGNGVYRLYHLNNPFFIKGIAYNIGHDWRDGSKIPSRFQLQKDFSLIKSMGANTIRRYDSDIYDYNILKYAKEYNLMVEFGFWFDPKIDYKNDFLKVQGYINKVRAAVEQHKNNPNILMWSLGNECYGQLKHHFEKPYLINVRHSYLRMLEYMANLIHELDPDRPVVTCVEHEESQLPGELRDLCFYSPSLDAIGINSYYKGQISRLDSVFTSIDTTRPYFISEFGPSGYWNSHYNTYIKNRIIEQNSLEKAGWYAEQWREYVKKNQNRCLGGISYCWQDRMEGSLTWFGITDYENGLKPSYWALKREWNDNCKDTIPYSDEIHLDYKKFDGSMIYTIANNSCLKNSVEIIWKLYDENTFTNYSNYNLSDDNHSIRIFSPNNGKLKLKLSVFIRDQSNNTISASLPVFFD